MVANKEHICCIIDKSLNKSIDENYRDKGYINYINQIYRNLIDLRLEGYYHFVTGLDTVLEIVATRLILFMKRASLNNRIVLEITPFNKSKIISDKRFEKEHKKLISLADSYSFTDYDKRLTECENIRKKNKELMKKSSCILMLTDNSSGYMMY